MDLRGIGVVMMAFALGGFSATHAQAVEHAPVAFEWGAKVPMRDGVKLNATVYRPRTQSQPLPCVFTLTPYIAQSYHDRGMYFAANGYVFLSVDTRGRGNSEGEFTPFKEEASDGHDVVEWLAQQPYCNGKVAMWGGSYAGFNQWASASQMPPHLATIVPASSPKVGVDFPFAHNMFYSYGTQWLTLVTGRTSQQAIFGDGGFWSAQYRHWYESHAPFNQLDRYVGNPSPIFQSWVSHPSQDAYWDSFNPTPAQLGQLSLPVLSICGQYDGDQPGALALYRDHFQYGTPAAKDSHYLIIGPWDHAGTRTPKADVGGLKFGEVSVLDMNALHKDWYDWTMKAGAQPKFLKDKVAFYVTGEEAWRYAPSLEGVTSGRETFHLDSTDARANGVFASGDLKREQPKGKTPDRYVYDPLDTHSSAWEQEEAANWLTDQRAAMHASDDSLFYHSPAFAEDTDVAGFFKFSAWLSLDQPDTDISVSLFEIKSDGSSVFLSSDSMRARYRNSLRQAKLVTPGAIERYDFNRFPFVARRLAKGSRLRLVVGPINSMYAEKNYNAGGVVAAESGKDARKVTVTLYHDRSRPSALSMPLASRSSVAR